MRRTWIGLGDHALDLANLVHQVVLRRQPAGGVGHQDVDAARVRRMHRVENHRRRVASGLSAMGNYRHVVALAPGHQLFACRSPEGVASGQQHALALCLEVLGQLADGGGLADTVDPADHHGQRFGAIEVHGLLQRRKQLRNQVRERAFEGFAILDALAIGAAAQVGDQRGGGVDTAIGRDQRVFKLFEQRLIDLQADEHRSQLSPRLGQARLESVGPARFGRRARDDGWRRRRCCGRRRERRGLGHLVSGLGLQK